MHTLASAALFPLLRERYKEAVLKPAESRFSSGAVWGLGSLFSQSKRHQSRLPSIDSTCDSGLLPPESCSAYFLQVVLTAQDAGHSADAEFQGRGRRVGKAGGLQTTIRTPCARLGIGAHCPCTSPSCTPHPRVPTLPHANTLRTLREVSSELQRTLR